MKIKKSKLRQLIRESYRKILFEDTVKAGAIPPIPPQVYVWVGQFAIICLAGFIVNDQHKKIRRETDQDLKDAFININNYKESLDDILLCTFFSIRYEDKNLFDELVKYNNAIKEAAKSLGLEMTAFDAAENVLRSALLDGGGEALKTTAWWANSALSNSPKAANAALISIGFIIDAAMTEWGFYVIKDTFSKLRDDLMGFEIIAEDIRNNNTIEQQKEEDKEAGKAWLREVMKWIENENQKHLKDLETGYTSAMDDRNSQTKDDMTTTKKKDPPESANIHPTWKSKSEMFF